MYLESEFCHFEVGIEYPSGAFKRNFVLKLDEYSAFRRLHGSAGFFTTAYRYDSPDIREANMIGNFYIDFDVTDIGHDFYQIKEDAVRALSALKAIFGIEKEAIQLYFSGNKGIHFVIPSEVFGITPREDLHMVFKSIADDLNKLVRHKTIDTRIYDKVRLFRVPNSLHMKSGLYKIPITFEELRDKSLEELQELAVRPRKGYQTKRAYSSQANRMYQTYVKSWEDEKKRIQNRKNKSRSTTLNFMPPCIQHILENGAKEGKRNNTVAVLASYFLQRGIKEEEAFERTQAWNEEMCSPNLPSREVSNTVQSIYRSEHRYGCRTLQDISICSSECRLYKEDKEVCNV